MQKVFPWGWIVSRRWNTSQATFFPWGKSLFLLDFRDSKDSRDSAGLRGTPWDFAGLRGTPGLRGVPGVRYFPLGFWPHRTWTDREQTSTVNDRTTEHIRRQIKSTWNEFGLEDCLDRRPAPSTAASWSGRITVPEPFSLTNNMNMDNVHRRKCMPEIELSKLKKEVEEELSLRHLFKGNLFRLNEHAIGHCV